jgi:MEMO1 family protein
MPAVAGNFYPADPTALARKIKKYLSETEIKTENENVRAIMVPHAGYDFSGPVAATAYAMIAGHNYKTVILIGSSHTSYFDGAIIDDSNFWQTPLGNLEANRELGQKLIKSGENIRQNGDVHAADHMLEVQLPFLQTVLAPGFKILPIALSKISNDDLQKLATALLPLMSGDNLLVISSDMSHYPAYEDAKRIDQKTLALIKENNIEELDEHVAKTMSLGVPDEETLLCGLEAVKLVMEIAKKSNWQAKILKYANSGDAAIGDKNAVVGYGAMIFKSEVRSKKSEDLLSEEQQKILLSIAKETVEAYVETGKIKDFAVSDERLKRPEGVFVTLEKNGQLRGCIGQIISTGAPLWQNVREMAIAACSEDNRFAPVSAEELPELSYEISVLSRPKKINDWQEVELGKHGVIVSRGWNKGVFLPQVAAETGWTREEFLEQLCYQKAGLPPDCYKNDPQVKLEIFTAQVFNDGFNDEKKYL